MSAAVVLMVLGIVTMFVRPAGVPLWAGPIVCAVVDVATTAIGWHDTRRALDTIRDPLLFLLFAVPLAVLLDRIGVFAALAAMVAGGRHLLAWLWVLAAGVTIVFNLDAAVVLLTPLYIRIANRQGIAPEVLAFQPALLACLASSPLPVSNLTNLIAAEQLDLGVGDFVRHLAVPTILACGVGWVAYRRWADHESSGASDGASDSTSPTQGADPGDRLALRRGLPIVGFVLIGFTVGGAFDVAAWVIAAVAVVWAAALVRSAPWRAVPIEAMLVAVGLAVLVAGAVEHLGVRNVLDASGPAGRLRALGFGVVASDLSNNLPTVLAAAPSLHEPSQIWALLVGTNMGPVLVISGSLSGLLWRSTARRFGVEVTSRRYSDVGVRVGLPALLVAGAVAVLVV